MHENIGEKAELQDVLRNCVCAACGHHVAVPFYDGGSNPLAMLAWPSTAEKAKSMERLPLTFVRCVDCGHVYNSEFDYAKVPYWVSLSERPNMMFNKGQLWKEHLLKIRDLVLKRLPPNPTVVEIGCGDGNFLGDVARAHPEGRYVGFDPLLPIDTAGGLVEARSELFDPAVHLAEYRPDLIISRHVLEHLIDPMGFLQALAFAVSWEGLETRLFIEVPCIDNIFTVTRTTDFFYEHNSHFTTESFTRLMRRCSREVELVGRSYDDEIVFGFVHIGAGPGQAAIANEAIAFGGKAEKSRKEISSRFSRLVEEGKKVAIWGGTGKAAAFINRYGLDADRFPLVVDSDQGKVGTFVPGVGQEIIFRDYLKENPVDVIIIAPQWRAKDIVREIRDCGITFDTILIESDGKVVDYFREPNPYNTGD